MIKAGGGWKVAAIEVVYERDDLRPLVPGARIAVDEAELAGLRAPYRFVAWTMGKAGITISQELPGDDRPAAVDALHIDAFRWAGIPWPGNGPTPPEQ